MKITHMIAALLLVSLLARRRRPGAKPQARARAQTHGIEAASRGTAMSAACNRPRPKRVREQCGSTAAVTHAPHTEARSDAAVSDTTARERKDIAKTGFHSKTISHSSTAAISNGKTCPICSSGLVIVVAAVFPSDGSRSGISVVPVAEVISIASTRHSGNVSGTASGIGAAPRIAVAFSDQARDSSPPAHERSPLFVERTKLGQNDQAERPDGRVRRRSPRAR